MVVVPANMPRLSFGPCKKKIWFWSLQNFLFFKIVPPGTIFRNKKFCRDLLKKQNILQGQKTTKWVQSSCATYTSHHKNGVRDYFKKQKFCRDQKQIFFLQGPKLKRAIFTGTSAIFKTKIKNIGRKSRLLYFTRAKHCCHCCRTTEIKCFRNVTSC